MSAFSKQKALEMIEDRFDIDTRKAVSQHWDDEEYDSETLGAEFADAINNDEELLPNDLDNLDEVLKLLHNFAKGINTQSNATKFSFNRIDFNVSNKDKKKYKAYYKNQCKTLVPGGQDQSLLQLICMGAKNQYPLMMNLIDSFTRQTIYKYIDDRKNNREINDYTFSEFNSGGTNFFSTLKKNGKADVANHCLQGCFSYFKRSFVPFKFSMMPTIKDDYYNICNIILDVILTINGAFKDNEANELAKRFFHTPFQLDLVFILNSVDKHIQESSIYCIKITMII